MGALPEDWTATKGADGVPDIDVLLQIRDFLRPEDFGAVGDDPTHDDAPAIQAALAALPARGGRLCLAAKTYHLGSTVSIGNGGLNNGSGWGHNIKVAGPGAFGQQFADVATILKWIGPAGGTMVQFLGEGWGGGLTGVALDGAGQAANGLIVNNWSFAEFDIYVQGCTGTAVMTTTQTHATATSCSGNLWRHLEIDVPAGAIGLHLHGDAANAAADTNQNVFEHVGITQSGDAGTTGILLEFCDFNVFMDVSVTANSAIQAGAYSVYFKGATDGVNAVYPQSNVFLRLSGGDGTLPIGGDTVNGTPRWNQAGYLYAEAPPGFQTGLFGMTIDDGYLQPFGGAGAPVAVAASAFEFLVAVAAQTQVAAVSSVQQGIYLVSMYLRVTAAATVTALAASWDPNGTQNEFYFTTSGGVLLNGAALAVGEYACQILVVANAGSAAVPRQVQTFVTPTVANAVYAASSICKIG